MNRPLHPAGHRSGHRVGQIVQHAFLGLTGRDQPIAGISSCIDRRRTNGQRNDLITGIGRSGQRHDIDVSQINPIAPDRHQIVCRDQGIVPGPCRQICARVEAQPALHHEIDLRRPRLEPRIFQIQRDHHIGLAIQSVVDRPLSRSDTHQVGISSLTRLPQMLADRQPRFADLDLIADPQPLIRRRPGQSHPGNRQRHLRLLLR